MKPANLRKRGGKSRSVHALADKVEIPKIFMRLLCRRCFFMPQKAGKHACKVVEDVYPMTDDKGGTRNENCFYIRIRD